MLERISGDTPALRTSVAAPSPLEARRPRVWTAAIGWVFAAAAVALWALSGGSKTGRLRYTPVANGQPWQMRPIFSPNGEAVAYTAAAGGGSQIFLRYLKSPTSTQLTHGSGSKEAVGWTGDSKKIYFTRADPSGGKDWALMEVPVFGGEPEFVMAMTKPYLFGGTAVSDDGRTAVYVRTEGNSTFLAYSSPIGAPWKKYQPAPVETNDVFNFPRLSFSRDGRKILYSLDLTSARQIWILPWPPGTGSPRRVLRDLPVLGGPPETSWFPDNRHVIASLQLTRSEPHHLYEVDVDSGAVSQVTASPGVYQTEPAVSPDGQRIIYHESQPDMQMVSVSLADATVTRLIATHNESMPAWSSGQRLMVYTSFRNGPQEIWLRDADGNDRPLVGESAFPPGTTNWWQTPSLSPDGTRVIFNRITTSRENRLWISSVSEGPPVRLTNWENHEFGGAWSPDGSRFVFKARGEKNGTSNRQLCVVKTTGQASPSVIQTIAKEDEGLPDWSPTGEWITFRDQQGSWGLVSPDGSKTVTLGKINTPHLAFSKDGKRLYGIRFEPPRYYLFSLDLASRQVKTIGDVGEDNQPDSHLHPGIRFSLTPDGKSITYSIAGERSTLWMLEGFPQPGFFGRFQLPWKNQAWAKSP